MRARSGASLVMLALLAACGGQGPSAPSPLTRSTSPDPGTSTTQSLVAATVSQAAINATMTTPRAGSSPIITFPCPDGGGMSITITSTGLGTSGTFSVSSRIEFTDCRRQSVTINGDPAILMDGTTMFVTGTATTASGVTETTHMTGGLRFDAPGASGRSRYDCTMTISMQVGSDGMLTQPTITSSGTITWEQPLGTVSVHSCGP